jgi:hypothetical protein
MQNRTFGPCLAANNRILISLVQYFTLASIALASLCGNRIENYHRLREEARQQREALQRVQSNASERKQVNSYLSPSIIFPGTFCYARQAAG